MTEIQEDFKNDKQRRNRRLALKIHLITYISVNLLLFIINFATGYHYRWHMWPLMSWGIGIALHALVNFVLNVYQNTYDRSLAITSSVTMIISAYLIWNDWFDNHQLEWFLFAIVPLGLIWLNHYVIHKIIKPKFGKSDSIYKKWVFREMENLSPDINDPNRIARKIVISRIIFRNHVIIYLVVNVFLFIVNAVNGLSNSWFLWPAMSWGINILFHAASNSIVKKKAIGEKITGKIFITYPLTICLYLVFVDGFSNGRFNWFWWAVVPIALLSLLISSIRRRTPSNIGVRKTRKRLTPNNKTINKIRIQQHSQPQLPSQTSNRRFCPQCGKPVTGPNHVFCEFCGLNLQD